jgi:hypothetical protein
MPRLDRLMVCVFLAFAALPVAAKLEHWQDHRLNGWLKPVEPPELAYEAVRSEAYQGQMTEWFELTRGLRNWAIWTDNTLLYHVFRETKWGSPVAIGRDGMLFHRDEIAYFNKAGSDLPDPREIDKLADRIAALQQRLARAHRALVPLFIPSKTTMYRDRVPALWTRALGDPRPSTEHIYLAMKRALDARHVVYADGVDLLAHASDPRDTLWGPSARHFSSYAACLCVGQSLQRYAELTATPPLDYPCQAELKHPTRDHSDLDLFRLTNVWGMPHDPFVRNVKRAPPADPTAHGPLRGLWISSSFGYLMMEDANNSRLFAQVNVDYYNNTVYGLGGDPEFDPKRHDEHWRSVFLTRDLYVLELNETYLTPGNFFGADAIDAIAAELGPELPAAPP